MSIKIVWFNPHRENINRGILVGRNELSSVHKTLTTSRAIRCINVCLEVGGSDVNASKRQTEGKTRMISKIL